MIQFNLLPDIKIEYLKARRQKHLVMLGSTVVIIASLGIMAILLSVVFGLQKKNIADLNHDINTNKTELQNTTNLNRMLTVQNQLSSLPQLHDNKAVATRLYSYITQVTPTSASISKVDTDFVQHTMTITGSADTLGTVNSFADALKFATYATAAAPTAQKSAFNTVVLSTFGRDNSSATYTITLKFDPVLFSAQSDVTLTVPNITTRSNGGAGALFKKAGQ
jgi:Tfp pilus assembly protein PilN